LRVGISCTGVGPTAQEYFIRVAAQEAERVGFSTVWSGEHVVLFEHYPSSEYSYGKNVPISDPSLPIIDPIISMTWAAAVTRTIEVGSAVTILPQRNPVLLAKELATLDTLSGGRVIFGAGVGWSKEEYDALGIPWADRGQRMDENLEAMRTLWRENVSTFHGRTISFERAHLYPKPLRNRDIPIMIGGESDRALQRVARFGDGWIAFKLSTGEAPQKVARLQALMKENGRDPNSLRLAVGIFSNTSLDDLKRYRDAGFTEFNLLCTGKLPLETQALKAGIAALGKRFVETTAAF
jgi:probable F420-dependent oxidoreductase